MEHPKIRIYRRRRPRGGAEFWEYICSTTHYPDKESALAGFMAHFQHKPDRLRLEFASTHGYYIED